MNLQIKFLSRASEVHAPEHISCRRRLLLRCCSGPAALQPGPTPDSGGAAHGLPRMRRGPWRTPLAGVQATPMPRRAPHRPSMPPPPPSCFAARRTCLAAQPPSSRIPGCWDGLGGGWRALWLRVEGELREVTGHFDAGGSKLAGWSLAFYRPKTPRCRRAHSLLACCARLLREARWVAQEGGRGGEDALGQCSQWQHAWQRLQMRSWQVDSVLME